MPNIIIIFLTAYENFALKAFEVKADDYIVKPYNETIILEAIDYIINKNFNNRSQQEILEMLHKLNTRDNFKKLPCEKNGRIILVDIDTICFCYLENDTTYIETIDNTYYINTTLQELSIKTNFFRCHKSFLVNLQMIKELYSWFNGTYKLVMLDNNNTEIPVSRSNVKEIKALLGFS